MAMCTLYNVPTDVNEMNVFSFNNQGEHTKIAQALFVKYGITVPIYPLDPIPLNDMGAWLRQHQDLHNVMNGLLGTNSNDLTDVNFKDPQQLSAWIQLHAQEHYVASNTLELT